MSQRKAKRQHKGILVLLKIQSFLTPYPLYGAMAKFFVSRSFLTPYPLCGAMAKFFVSRFSYL